MSVTVEYLAKHSSAKDHVAMTGGTLSADKLVRGDGPLVLQHEFFPVAVVRPDSSPEELNRLYSGVHSIEHALASPEGGDLRARLDEVAEAAGGAEAAGILGAGAGARGGIGGRLIDMSPYVPGLLGAEWDGGGGRVGGSGRGGLVVGFRSTYVSDGSGDGGLLPRDVMVAAYGRSLRVIRELFVSGGAVPFSTPEECGQYDMHSAEVAVELIDGIGGGGTGTGAGAGVVEVGARELYVCDLRLVKPRLAGAFEQRMLDVLGGHFISQVIEASVWKSLEGAGEGTVAAGNFGCSTGEYLMVGNPGGLGRSELLRSAHVAVARTLGELAGYDGDDVLRRMMRGLRWSMFGGSVDWVRERRLGAWAS